MLAISETLAFDGTGAVHVTSLNGTDLETEIILLGETANPNSYFGSGLSSGMVNGEPALAIGAEKAHGIGKQNGAVYTWIRNGGL